MEICLECRVFFGSKGRKNEYTNQIFWKISLISMTANGKRHKALSATAKMKNMSNDIVTFLGMIELVNYVKGQEPDRWHWCKNCTQYPLVVVKSRSNRPVSDLCDQCKAKEERTNCKT
jgi:hypothetical protein